LIWTRSLQPIIPSVPIEARWSSTFRHIFVRSDSECFFGLIFLLRNSKNLFVRAGVNEGVSRAAKLQGRLVVDETPARDD